MSSKSSTDDGPPARPLEMKSIARPVMTQRWADVVFLHWRYPAAAVQRLLPPGVQLDTYDGSAWIGLVPFSMERIALTGLPPFPIVSSFPEVNVRTYVHSGHRRAVWFFSLDIDKLLPTAVARLAYNLPYCYSDASHTNDDGVVSSLVVRRWPAGPERPRAELRVRTGDPVPIDDPLNHFLTSRWGLISASRRRLRYAPVEHPPWPLHGGEIELVDEGLIAATGLPAPRGEPHVLWAPGVDVRVGRPVRLPRRLENR